MPRPDLTYSQLSEARVIAEKAAWIMEEKPTNILPPKDAGTLSRWKSGFWAWNYKPPEWIPHFALDGTDPDADAIATARMKERLIEWGEAFYCYYAPEAINPWIFIFGLGSETSAPLEVLAVAKALIAVAEARKIQPSPGSVGDKTKPGTEREPMKQPD